MTNAEWMESMTDGEVVMFENPRYEGCLVGLTISDGPTRAVYSCQRMVELLMREGMSSTSAEEFIQYNTLRTIPYAGAEAPIVVYARNEDGGIWNGSK